MKNIHVILMIMVMTVLSGCSSITEKAGENTAVSEVNKKIEITALIGKPELRNEFEQMVAEYNRYSDTGHVTIKTIVGKNWVDGLTEMYNNKKAPTVISGGEAFDKFKGNYLDLSEEPWIRYAMGSSLDLAKSNGQILGMPVTVEAFGLIYNKKVLDEAVGEGFDPESIKTRKSLEELFKKIEAKGKKAIHLSSVNWSLGAHLSNIMYTTQSYSREERHDFIENMKNGKIKLMGNDIFEGWLDTFDIMIKYNGEKKNPLSVTYEDGAKKIASGEYGFWFMGNWAAPNIKAIDLKGDYGFIPVPISNNENDYGNSQISMGIPSYYYIDASQSTKEQQEEAKKFLNWMVSTPEGEDYIVNKFSFIPVFRNIKIKPSDAISRDVLRYIEEGRALEWMNNYYPPNIWPEHGETMRKYIAGEIDREKLANEFEKSWKKAK